MLAHRQAARVDGFYRSHQSEDNTFSEVLQDGKNYVEIQGRFSSDGKFMDGKYVPGIVDELLDSVSGAFNDTTGLHRLRVTVEVEDLGADVKFGKPASETQHSPAPQRLTVGKLIPAPDISPTAIDPAPEVAV